MKVLLTGADGYVGRVLWRLLRERGHRVVALDSGLFAGCALGPEPEEPIDLRIDLRAIARRHLEGFDAVLHLAGISNDPLGDLDPAVTFAINHEASVRLARLAKEAGVERFVFASSCSAYGAAGDAILDEEAPFNPVTPYAESKIRVERDLSALADDRFSPTFLRAATAYGFAPRLRGDLVVNNLLGHAFATGRVLIKSDGSPWRPLVHVEDMAAAFVAALEAPRERIHAQAFNVGRDEDNWRVRDLAEMVEAAVPGARIVYAPGGGPDRRNYRVSFAKIRERLPAFRPRWTVRTGISALKEAYERFGLTLADLEGGKLVRLARIKELLAAGRLDRNLAWKAA
ncbi:MAG: SDR family oxidoreductase [Geminicoccaceae bacterium]|nr:SDR family oxidoreductase [Geminicoccaceae bacterium]